ncbi:MarR family winged helix-turn-helix transcriptional regulator [Paenibacillus sp. Soil522]|uniref:MarR family winged helix-turn-helix transcriptional regulator n=1 Tax=Paenibacillus sp. Soil522 TaxID=1736388 RepID=UPI0006F47B58|nr:MarR family transcriptional regulator [Paenibacillus sp. Soil522]KRE49359.1 MarR family transcriptional regulator [Paenibacillus sp. Soil522]
MDQKDTESFLSKRDERLGLMIWFRLSRVYNQSLRESHQHLKKWNLSAAQFDMLAQVGAHDRLTQQQLADKLFVTKGNITQLLGKLEELGLVRREQEWKTKYVSLTEKGKALFNDVVPVQEQFQASQYNALDRDEKRQLLDLLKKIQN